MRQEYFFPVDTDTIALKPRLIGSETSPSVVQDEASSFSISGRSPSGTFSKIVDILGTHFWWKMEETDKYELGISDKGK